MMKPLDNVEISYKWIKLLTGIGLATALYSCANSSATPEMHQQAMSLPVVSVASATGTTFREYPASLEGKVNVEMSRR
jgi:membrane fusion protein (multidrug efflux system)